MRATFRTAAVAAGAAGAVVALALPAGAAFAAGTPAPHPTATGAARESARVFVRAYENVGGSGFDARVYKIKNGYEADLFRGGDGGAVWHTMKTYGKKSDVARHDGARFVLNTDGTLKAWTGTVRPATPPKKTEPQKTDPKTEPQKTDPKTAEPQKTGPASVTPATDGTKKVTPIVPRGGVKAGAEGVVGYTGGSSVPLIAGSAGIAAVGAAGLGFAMLRRGRSDR
ncbi:hypothetical protein ABT084_15230 [Streptomyces sp. NPDC002138]|uniref:hypothetical protein n=1 Tax=Streptomyces sp. NPDC002138 TaxID=3154410 RepID=UPI00331AE077